MSEGKPLATDDQPPDELIAGRRGQEQSLGSLLQSGEVRHRPHPELADEVGVVDKVIGQPAVVEVRELFEHQEGQQLGLSILLGAVLVPVRRKNPADSLVRDLQAPAGDFLVVISHITRHDQAKFVGFLYSTTDPLSSV